LYYFYKQNAQERTILSLWNKMNYFEITKSWCYGAPLSIYFCV